MIQQALADIGIVATAVWALTEIVHRISFVSRRIDTDKLAVLLGMLSSVVLHVGGWLEAPEGPTVGKILSVALLGALGTAVAGLVHDKVIRPIKGGSER